MLKRRSLLAAITWYIALPAASQTAPFGSPLGPVILEVDGAIQRHNIGLRALFDLAMLDSLPQVTIQTTTIWTEGNIVFSGPSLGSVLDWLAAEPGAVTASAVNGYSVTLAPGTVNDQFPILATRKDGLPYTVRESGPIWLIYPYDSSEKFRTDLIYSQSVWQLTNLTIGPE